MLVIGITGTIASGKSTVDAMLLDLGADALFDADHVVHGLLRGDAAVRAAIEEAFGAAVLAPDGSIDRRALGVVVFADRPALRVLEAILHPAVRRTIRASLATLPPESIAVIDAVKLLEGDLRDLCSSVWWVLARPDQQLERLVRGRGLSADAALARLAAQPRVADWLPYVNVVIDNSGDLEDTRKQVHATWQGVLAAVPRARAGGLEKG